MFKSRWIIAIAFGLAATLGQAQQHPENPEGEPGQYEQPAQSLPIPVPVELVEDDTATEARQRHEEEARQREIEDLIAQQGMNAATQAMNAATQDMRNYAFYSTIFVFFGTLAVGFTLYLMVQANRAAMSAVASERAWIGRGSLESGQVNNLVTDDGIENGYVFSVGVRNFGRSPAIGVATFCDHLVSETEPGEIAFTPNFSGDDSSTVVPPGEGVANRIILGQKDTELLHSRTHALYIFYACKYLDVFTGVERNTRFSIKATYFCEEHTKDGVRQQSFEYSTFGENRMS